MKRGISLCLLIWHCLFSLPVISIEVGPPRSCDSKLNGTWLELESLSLWSFKKNCEYEFEGANCSVKGMYWSTSGPDGSLVVHNPDENENQNCLVHGETSCEYLLKKKESEMRLQCSLRPPVRLISTDATQLNNPQSKALVEAFNKSNVSTLKETLERLSKKKVNDASAALGFVYFHGSRGFKKDYTEALYWNRLASSQGHHQARVLAGTQYLYGLGTPKDFSKAEAFFLPAAEQDDPVPQKALAGMYLLEKPNKKRRAKAHRWLARASELGDQQAKDFLASLNPKEKAQLDKVCKLLAQQLPDSLTQDIDLPCHSSTETSHQVSNHPITIINLPPAPIITQLPASASSGSDLQRKLASGDPLADLAYYHSLERRFGVDFGVISPMGEFKENFDGASLLGFHFSWEALPPFSLRLSTHRASSNHKTGQGGGKLTVSQIGIGTQASFPQRRLIPFVKLEGTFAFNDVSFGSNKFVVAGNDTFVTTLGLNLGGGMDIIVGRELSFGVDVTYHYLMTKNVTLDDNSQLDVGSDYTSLVLRVNF